MMKTDSLILNLKNNLFTATESEATPQITLFGEKLHNVTLVQAASNLVRKMNQTKQLVAFINADCVNKLFTDQTYRAVLSKFNNKYADGIGMRLAANMQGERFIDNVNGTDLFPVLLNELAQNNKSVYLLGGEPGVAERVSEYINQQFPSLKVMGVHHGYFQPCEQSDVMTKINKSGADALFVAFGAPKQEQWIAENHNNLSANLVLGVGGLFDFYSGKVSRAPLWLRKLSLEWVWRLLMQPKDKAKRYLVGNPLFLVRALKHAWRQPRLSEVNLISHLQAYFWRQRCYQNAYLKRAVDCIASSLIAVLLLPLFAAVIALIRIESSGPVFFKQVRVGKNGKHFTMYKFRSMYLDAEERKAALLAKNESGDGVIFKMKYDPRITRVGRFIRKFSIDELPQLWNVIIGDMSLVGPRPPLPNEVADYTAQQIQRLQSKPGITCVWQVSGRSDIPFEQQVELDIQYIREKSLINDMLILLKTIPAVVMARGAY